MIHMFSHFKQLKFYSMKSHIELLSLGGNKNDHRIETTHIGRKHRPR